MMTLERGSYERCGTERTRSSRLGPESSLRIGQVQLETWCRNLNNFVGILPPSRISDIDAVKVAEDTEVCATSIPGSAIKSRFFCHFSEVDS